ncbi:class I SAM-dependent methyltransferase [Flavobacterium cerinum]|uniref:Class I SAM-dependent methyltransferase n=1 Tax=Flavobacterium cerinum TaxID=2502784 RepID=A0ABY5IW51_9FLAO|nr:class I SAM-dependent methyltransferase [Flavobacterium cerinum]UUC47035.1 class I SAM-dependent methyltransferase [Flavobacterium cerinum]
MKKKWTGERLETFIYSRDTVDHLHRYAVAQPYVKGKTVLDIASGEGYGTHLLSETAAFVYGVDIDESAVEAAKQKYKKENVRFQQGSTSAIPLDDHSIDIVISFETIEHHDQHEMMLSEIKRVLRPDGILIISTPDKLYYSDKRNFNNPFHVKELYQHEFTSLLSNYFGNQQLLTQHHSNGNSLIADVKSQNVPKFLTGNYNALQQIDVPGLYLIAIVSDKLFDHTDISIFDGGSIIEKEYQQKIAEIYNSNSYRFGHFLLLPVKWVKKIFKR